MSFIGSEEDYKLLVQSVLNTDEGNFPVLLSRDDPMHVTLPEIKEFIDKFKKDTGLDVTIHISTCDGCKELNMTIVIDLNEEQSYGKLHLIQ